MNKNLKIEKDWWGFFSNSSVKLYEIICFYNKNKILPIVDSSEQWKLYKDSEDKNVDISSSFFKVYNGNSDIEIDEYNIVLDHFQYYLYNTLNFNVLNKYIETYFQLTDEVLNIKNDLINKYKIIPSETISICFRGNDKTMEVYVPSYDEMYNKLIEIKNKYPNYKILVQSDEIDFYEYIKNRISDIIVIDEIIKINHNKELSVRDFIEDGSKKYQAKLFLAILSIISETKHVITNSGNVGLWICLFRGNAINVYQEYGKKWIE